MEVAPRPKDEAERLAALYELNILDTPPDERFDRVTRLATSMFEVPIAYVAMIDSNRQWFKSACGFSSSETGRDISFCSYTILQDEPLVIGDTLLDWRFQDSPLVTQDPHFRFYAGCQLRTPTGYKVATLCIGDHKPRQFQDADVAALEDLARIAQDQLTLVDIVGIQKDLRALKGKVEQSNDELERRNKFIREVFGRYMTDEVADTVLTSPDALKLGGDRRKVSVLMCDIRGFTPISEKLPPEQVVKGLNNYLESMVEIISKHNGTIDSFIGDAILVIFGAPLQRSNDAERAVACAVEMQSAMGRVNEKNRNAGLPEFQIGIGVNTGDVIVGNIGCQRRMKYSVIGSPVNIAARIESLTIGGQIVITEETMREVKGVVRVDGKLWVKVKGLNGPLCIYDIGGVAAPYNISLPTK